jgi:hypothetical protein
MTAQVIEEAGPDVPHETHEGEECQPDCTYFDVLHFQGAAYTVGNFVYLRSQGVEPFIAQIERLWRDKDGLPWMHGDAYFALIHTVYI